MSYTSTLVLLLHLIYLSYLSNVYRPCSFFKNLGLFGIDNARVIYRKIRYIELYVLDLIAYDKLQLTFLWSRSQWLHSLRRGSAVDRLLGFRVRITPEAWSIYGSQIDVFELGRSLVQRNSKKCGVSECDGKASRMKRSWPNRGCRAMGGKNEQFGMH